MLLGKCPYCSDGEIEVRDKEVNGKKSQALCLHQCKLENRRWRSFEPTENSTCDYKLWQNSLAKYGKWLGYKEVRELLSEESIEVELLSKKYGKKVYYTKSIVLNQEYGVSVLWD